MNKKRIMNQVHYPLFIVSLVIPVQLEDARFRKSERFITKAHLLRVIPLKRNVTLGMICSAFPKAGLETLYAALLILRIRYTDVAY